MSQVVIAQNEFIAVNNNKFYEGDSAFYFLGFNAYYLQWMASETHTSYIVDEVFEKAEEMGVKVVRMPAHNTNVGSRYKSVIRHKPYHFNERGFKALDYVIHKAKEHNIKLILTLTNNYSNFGGIPQYLRWANKFLLTSDNFNFTHNDFFVNDSMKVWYKHYISEILNRENEYTSTLYKNEPAIFSFELINEAANLGESYINIYEWYNEMSAYFKSIDKNHLLTTGETGYDSEPGYYSDVNFFYNSVQFIYNGSKGTSYFNNTSIDKIDYGSFHLYPESWGLESAAGNTWINDHSEIAERFDKTSLLGEFGIIGDKVKDYQIYLRNVRRTSSKSALVWNYVHPDIYYIADEYAFNEIENPELIELFKFHTAELDKEPMKSGKDEINKVSLLQNYPNPFNPTTVIRYDVHKKTFVKIDLFNSLGQHIEVLKEGTVEKGTHELYLSFENLLLSSGTYFYRITADGKTETRKMSFIK